ncbi:DNA-3-methyladenine glycosylase, partial [Escherichia coli]|nr:DNA-3-methyladenine glycosylase [Escherichia coli]
TGNHGIVIASDGVPPPEDPVVGPRIGITRAVDFPWRWHIRDHRHVSIQPRRASAPARKR